MNSWNLQWGQGHWVQEKPATAMISESHSNWCHLFSWRNLSKHHNKTRLYKGWLIDMKTKSEDQGGTDNPVTQMGKKNYVQSGHHFQLNGWQGHVPIYIIQTIISQWCFIIHFHRESPEANKEMSIECQILLSLKIDNNEISYSIFF